MRSIILARREGTGESLLLDCLAEESGFIAIKLPGILKSKKRSSYFYYPGAVWDFTLTVRKDHPNVPRESQLISDPCGLSPRWESLELLKHILVPVRALSEFDPSPLLFQATFGAVLNWSWNDYTVAQLKSIWLLLQILKMEGYLGEYNHCRKCGQNNEGRFSPAAGLICHNCAPSQSRGISSELTRYLFQLESVENLNLKTQGKKIHESVVKDFSEQVMALLRGDVFQ